MSAFFGCAELCERAFVGVGRRLFEDEREASRPEVSAGDDVCLGGEQRDVRGEVDPGEQADHEGEGAVGVAGVLERVADVVAAERLQELVEDAGGDRAAAELPPADVAWR